jgi:hypothetical protein
MKRLAEYLYNPKSLLLTVNKSQEEILNVDLKFNVDCKANYFIYFKDINCVGVSCFECPFYDEHTLAAFISKTGIHRASNGRLYEDRTSKSGKKYRKYFK